MDTLILVNRYLHIIVGFCGLAAWWVPIVTAKGGVTHKRFGRIFVIAAYVVGVSAMLSAPLRISDGLLEGMSWSVIAAQAGFLIFLGYLGVLTVNFAYFGMRLVRTRRDPSQLGGALLRTLTWTMMAWSVVAAVFAVVFWAPTSIIMLVLAPIGIVQGFDQRRYVAAPPSLNKPWLYEHMDAMLGAGIAFHTAFLVFGSRTLFDYTIFGAFNWVPWVLPALVGNIAGSAWRKSYMRKFGDLPPAAPVRVSQV